MVLGLAPESLQSDVTITWPLIHQKAGRDRGRNQDVADEYWIKKRMQHLFHRVTGQRVMSFERPHHGISDVLDIIRTGLPVGTIIDVGANTGQSALRFRAAFPQVARYLTGAGELDVRGTQRACCRVGCGNVSSCHGTRT